MIFDAEDVATLSIHLDNSEPVVGWSERMLEQEHCLRFISHRPHLLFPIGFDEAKVFKWHPETIKSLSYRFRLDSAYLTKLRSYALFKNHSGAWFLLGRPEQAQDGYSDYFWPFIPEAEGPDFRVPLHEPLSALKSIENGTINLSSLTSFTTHYLVKNQNLSDEIGGSAKALISDIQQHNIDVKSINPFDLEDLVAELMRARGHRVLKTKKTRDGGRDLIVTGEFLPNQLIEMAVEITTLRTVGIQKVAYALQRNRNFPLVMIAASGRFSAGVLQEAGMPENKMRLKLVNGLTLSQWIHAYCF